MIMESTGGDTMALKCSAATDNMVTKSLDNIVGNLWQARQESSGSSMGNQSPRNGDDLSDGEPESPDEVSIRHRRPSSNSDVRDSTPEDTLAKFGARPAPEKLETDEPDKDRGGGGGVRLKDPRELFSREDQDSARAALLATAGLHNLPNMPNLEALEAFQRQRDFFSSPQSILNAAGLRTPPGLPMNFPTLPRPPSQPGTPSSSRNSGSPIQQPGTGNSGSSQQNWSFEEQFKQLYEIDDNPKRKEFLDELFSFMQKRGTPINRLPIMAKQVLDLYELFNLVIARGGLVEVINKKLWQEVIKGLGLPSSITSAAFTLRTQYTKYLYPLECRKKNLSNPNELQAAIEGNKREGRRTSYGGYPEMLPHPFGPGGIPVSGVHNQLSPMGFGGHTPRSLAHQLNGSSHLPASARSPPNPLMPNSNGSNSDHLSALEMTRLALWKMYNQNSGEMPRPPSLPVSLPSLPSLPHELFGDRASLGLHQKALEEAVKREVNLESLAKLREDNSKANGNLKGHLDISGVGEDDDDIGEELEIDKLEETEPRMRQRIRSRDEDENGNSEDKQNGSPDSPAKKRFRIEDLKGSNQAKDTTRSSNGDENLKKKSENSPTPRKQLSLNQLGMQGANIKITSRGENNGDKDSSLVVSLEINGINYQGVLFAQTSTNAAAIDDIEVGENNTKS